MSIEKKLKDYPYIMEEVNELNKEILVLQESKHDTNITTKYEVTGIGTGAISDKVGEQLVIVETYEKEIALKRQKIEQLICQKSVIEKSLEMLGHEEKTVIRMRYFQGYKWDYISRKLNKTNRAANNIKNKAVRKLDKYIVRNT